MHGILAHLSQGLQRRRLVLARLHSSTSVPKNLLPTIQRSAIMEE